MPDLDRSELVFLVVAFEGPDGYSQAGGLGIRVTGLTRALAELGFETHLFFLGDPGLPGVEARAGGRLVLHRWGQWISRWHPAGVYDGEEGKRRDLAASLPPWLIEQLILPTLAAGRIPVVLSEDWQTADCACGIAERLHGLGLGEQVIRFWNANNTYSFDRIGWPRLSRTNRMTAVSRYMRAILRDRGVDARVIPNGIPGRLLEPVEPGRVVRLRERLGPRSLLFKMARSGEDKGWPQALEAIERLRRAGRPVTLVARCGGPSRRGEDLAPEAIRRGLQVCEAGSAAELDSRLPDLAARGIDVVNLRFGVTEDLARLLYAGSDAVLANSITEPFGLVGLEAMAAGGLVITGGTGEDYAVDGVNAIVLQSLCPEELTDRLGEHLSQPARGIELRRRAMETAARFTWDAVIRKHLLPAIDAELAVTPSPHRQVRPKQVTRPTAPYASAGAGRQPGWLRGAWLAILLCFVTMAGASGQAVLKGKVLMDPSDVPLANAEVVLEALGRSARTGSDGRFLLDSLPGGRYRILVRRVGYQPFDAPVTLKDRDTVDLTFALTPLPVVLESLLAAGNPPVPASSRFREFEERRRMGFGRFLSWAELRLREERTLASVLAAEGVRIVDRGGNRQIAMSSRTGRDCPMQVWLDGVRIARGGRDGMDLGLIPVRSLRGVEIYRSAVETPPPFSVSNSECGTLVLWTRDR